MSRFIDISLYKNLSLLDRNYNQVTDSSSESIPSETLFEIWEDINLEYTELMDNGTMKSLLTNACETELLKIKFSMITSLVDALSVMHDPELVDMLKELGYRFPFDPSDSIKYHKDLSRVLTLAKSIIVQIRNKEAEARSKSPAETSTAEPTVDDWQDSIVAIREDVKYHVKPEEITVYEYARMHKNLIRKLQSKIKKPRL